MGLPDDLEEPERDDKQDTRYESSEDANIAVDGHLAAGMTPLPACCWWSALAGWLASCCSPLLRRLNFRRRPLHGAP